MNKIKAIYLTNLIALGELIKAGEVSLTECFKADLHILNDIVLSDSALNLDDMLKLFRAKAGLKGVSLETLKDYFMLVIRGINE